MQVTSRADILPIASAILGADDDVSEVLPALEVVARAMDVNARRRVVNAYSESPEAGGTQFAVEAPQAAVALETRAKAIEKFIGRPASAGPVKERR